MRAIDAFRAANIATSTSQVFTLIGGEYAFFGAGSTLSQALLQILGPDNTTYQTAVAPTPASNVCPYTVASLPAGQYRLNVSGTGIYLTVIRIPGE